MNTEPSNTTTSNRRNFLRTAAFGAASVAGAALIGQSRTYAASGKTGLTFKEIPEPGYLNLPGLAGGHDIKILNYALALEDLESDLYVQAVMRLTTGGTNKLGQTIPGLMLGDDEPDVKYVTLFTPVEAEHRDFLRGSLNGLIDGIAISQFKYDFGMPGLTREQVLDLVLTAESTGLRAYLGAVPYLKTQVFLTAAASIQGTEARHTAVITAIQNKLFNQASPKPVAPLATDNHGIDQPLDPDSVLAAVSPYIVRS